MGEETWKEAYRTFISEWAYKHPTPWDFFDTFERFAGQDLDWFWTSFYYETWNVDFDAVSVDPRTGGGGTVHIANRGDAPFPVTVRITTTSGGALDRPEVPMAYWLDGHRERRHRPPVGRRVGHPRRDRSGGDRARRGPRQQLLAARMRSAARLADLHPRVPRPRRLCGRRGLRTEAAVSDHPTRPGRLVIVGGALEDDNAAVYRAIVDGAIGDGPLCVLPTASGVPESSMASAVARPAALHARRCRRGVPITSENAPGVARPGVLAAARRCSGFFFTGGDQSRVVDTFLPEGDTTPAFRACAGAGRRGPWWPARAPARR